MQTQTPITRLTLPGVKAQPTNRAPVHASGGFHAD